MARFRLVFCPRSSFAGPSISPRAIVQRGWFACKNTSPASVPTTLRAIGRITMRAPRRYLAALAFLVLSLSYSFGQGYDPSSAYGSFPFQSKLQDSESVNLATGNLHFELPLVRLPGRNGHDFVYSMSYNSQIWWGFIFTDPLGHLHQSWTSNHSWSTSSPNTSFDGNVSPPNWPNIRCQGNYRTYLPDGRSLYFALYTSCQDYTNPQNPIPAPQFNVFSGPSTWPKDSDGVAIPGPCALAYMSLGTPTTVVLEDGEKLSFPNNQVSPVDEDTNGNSISYTINTSSFTDTLGRQVNLGNVLAAVDGGQQDITYKNSDGVSQAVSLIYTNWSYATQFHWAGVANPSGTSVLLSSVIYPNGDRYDFQYNNYQELSKIIYPTGGYTRYEYDTFLSGDTPPDIREVVGKHVCRDPNSRAHLDQNGLPGACVAPFTEDNTTFAPTLAAVRHPHNSVSQVVSPAGDTTSYSFVDAFESQRKIYSGSTTLLRTVDSTSTSCGAFLQKTLTLDDGAVERTQWDRQGNLYTAKREYGQVNGVLTLLRNTTIDYLHVNPINNQDYYSNAIHILDRKTNEVVKDGSGTILSQTTYEYDNYTTAMSGSGATQQDSAYLASATPLITARGNLTATKHWLNTNNSWLTTTNTYDDAGNVLVTKDPKTNATTFSYVDSWSNSACGPASGNAAAYATKITNALNQFSTRKYNSCSGTVGSSTDANSQQTSFSYDAVGRPTLVQYPDGGQVSNCYSDGGSGCTASNPQLSETTTTAVTGTLNIVTQTLVDGIGQVVTNTLQSDPGGATSTDTVYDGVGRVFKKSNPHRSGTLPTDGWTQFTYDALNRVTAVLEPDSSQVLTSYVGNQTTVTDEAGKQRTSQTDALGRLTAVWEDPGTSPHLNYKTEYQYNLLDNLLCAVQKGTDTSPFTDCASAPSAWHPRSFAYDSLSRLTSAANPESGTISYFYDSNGNLSSKVAPLPNVSSGTVTTTYQYDVLNRLTGKTYTGMTMPSLLFGYDGATPTGCTPAPPSLTDTYAVGRRTWMCDGSGATAWSHDKMGRVLSEKQTQTITGGTNVTKTTSYDYNLDGSLKTLTYPSGNVVNYTIGAAGRVTKVSDSSNSYVGYSGNVATYTPGGALGAMTNGHTGSFAGIVTTNSYTNRLQPAVLSAANPTQTIFSLSYGFNPGHDNGNVQQIVNNLDSTRSVAFTYDPLNRISQANTTTTTGANCWGETYTIDAWGNLTNIAGVPSMTGCHTESQNVPVSTNNRITGWCYDGAGNLLDMGSCGPPAHSFVYDAEGHLQSPPAVGISNLSYTYYYDGDGNRVQKCNANPCTSGSSPGTLYWFGAGGNVLDESGRTGTMQAEYVYFNGQRIARRDLPSGNVHYYFSNHLGSASLITDSSGNIQQQTDYYPYGGIAYNAGADANRYKFTAKERDAESGLDNFGARYDSSSLARFMAADPSNLSVDFWLPQTWNRYSYVLNNPLRFVDRNGLWPTDVHNEIINKAFPGLSKSELKNLQDASASVDRDQSPGGSYKHAMSDATNPNGVVDSSNKMVDFITDNEQSAQQIQANWIKSGQTGIAPNAMTVFGNALHTVTDGTSPAHEGMQGWYGAAYDPFGSAFHVFREIGIFFFTKARQEQAIGAAHQAYLETFGFMELMHAEDGLQSHVTHKVIEVQPCGGSGEPPCQL
jgi:RHS repeat-associated protein